MQQRTMREINAELKEIIEPFVGKKVTNKKISELLHIPPSTFNTSLKRGSIPYEEILRFCLHTSTDPMKIFYK